MNWKQAWSRHGSVDEIAERRKCIKTAFGKGCWSSGGSRSRWEWDNSVMSELRVLGNRGDENVVFVA